jgi:hypothetical protein
LNEIEKEELLNLVDAALEQNYIQINEQYYMGNEGLAMGDPNRLFKLKCIFTIYNIHQLLIF